MNSFTIKRLAALLLCVCSSLAISNDKPSVDELVAKLGASDFSTRQSAEDALVGMGQSIVEQIKAAIPKATDPEVSDRLRSVLERIKSTGEVAETMVDLSVTSAKAAFEELAKSAGLTYSSTSPKLDKALSEQTVDLKLSQTPWLIALDKVCALTGHGYRLETGKLVVQDNSYVSGSDWVKYQALAYRAQAISTMNLVDYLVQSDRSNTEMVLNLAYEPKMKFMFAPTVVVTRAEDDLGTSLLKKTESTQYLPTRVEDEGYWRYRSHVELPAKQAKMIANLEAEVNGVILVENTQLIEDQLPAINNKTLNFSGNQVKVVEFAQNEGAYELTIILPLEMSPTLVTRAILDQKMFVDTSIVQLSDTQGNLFQPRVHNSRIVNGEKNTVLRFSAPENNPNAKPAKLTWNVPSKTREIHFTMQFNNLPLP